MVFAGLRNGGSCNIITVARGVRPRNFSRLDTDWQEWQFQLKMHVAAMSATMSADIRTAETMTNAMKAPSCARVTCHLDCVPAWTNIRVW